MRIFASSLDSLVQFVGRGRGLRLDVYAKGVIVDVFDVAVFRAFVINLARYQIEDVRRVLVRERFCRGFRESRHVCFDETIGSLDIFARLVVYEGVGFGFNDIAVLIQDFVRADGCYDKAIFFFDFTICRRIRRVVVADFADHRKLVYVDEFGQKHIFHHDFHCAGEVVYGDVCQTLDDGRTFAFCHNFEVLKF